MFTHKNMVACEKHIMKMLKWDIYMLTPLHYLKAFYSTGIVFESDKLTKSTHNIYSLSEEFLEVATVDNWFNNVEDHVLAMA